ncbi:MAG TPA: 2-oxoacid:acceptor oxidoreductase family protein [Candidatus Kapabacteria bacterium]|nr:2-oxoacid:acceptor oxidoreductase family protein [Candidatus Kapabacteria bacterium]HPO62003.1 2-oxoacid:acceptor oxidoreductase family protein [Candidatus Kapabacteria bacterium]
MTEESIFSGFGGQGVLTMGMLLGYAGIIEDKEVTWMPSYGPEMRGGTANCITIVSDELISSPIISKFDTVVALNQPSVDKFEAKVKKGGNIIFDSTNILIPPTREDINIYSIAASEAAVSMKNTKVLNMIVLGAFIEARKVVKPETIFKALEQVLPERYHKLIPLNKQAFEVGMGLIKNQ